jgi:D-alanine-D-alanine ligase
VSPAGRSGLGLPVFVKPATGGSSLGVSKVSAWADLPAAVRKARDSEARTGDAKVMVEAACTAARSTWGAGVPGRRVVAGRRWRSGSRPGTRSSTTRRSTPTQTETVFEIPARLPQAVAARVQDRAVRAFRAMECSGLLRDGLLLPAGEEDRSRWSTEINTFPGFTTASQYPQIWRAAGIDYPELVERAGGDRAGGPTGGPRRAGAVASARD